MPSAPGRRSLAFASDDRGGRNCSDMSRIPAQRAWQLQVARSHLSARSRTFPPSEASPAFCNSHYSCRRRTLMKRVALLVLLAGWLVPLASAQDHFQVGGYGDYFRISQTKTNMAGFGLAPRSWPGTARFARFSPSREDLSISGWIPGPLAWEQPLAQLRICARTTLPESSTPVRAWRDISAR